MITTPHSSLFSIKYLVGRFPGRFACDFSGLSCRANLFRRLGPVSSGLTQTLVLPAVECLGLCGTISQT